MQIDNEYMRLTDIAKFLAAEGATPLASEEILSRLWAAFWTGELEGKIFIFQPGGAIGTRTDERLYFYRDQLFCTLKGSGGLTVEPSQGDDYQSATKNVFIDGGWVTICANPGEAAYKELILNLNHYYERLVKVWKEIYIDQAMGECSFLIAWWDENKPYQSFLPKNRTVVNLPETPPAQVDSTNTGEAPAPPAPPQSGKRTAERDMQLQKDAEKIAANFKKDGKLFNKEHVADELHKRYGMTSERIARIISMKW